MAGLAGLALATAAGEGPGPTTQQAYVKASNAGMNDQFGYAGAGVALAGDTRGNEWGASLDLTSLAFYESRRLFR